MFVYNKLFQGTCFGLPIWNKQNI